MLTYLTKVIPEDSLRYRINESLHKGTFLGGKWLQKKVKKLELKGYLRRQTVYIYFPESDNNLPYVTDESVVREASVEEAKKANTYRGYPILDASGKIYPLVKGLTSYIAYPALEGYKIWSDEHHAWIDVTEYFQSNKCVTVHNLVLDANAAKSFDRLNNIKYWHRKFTSAVYKFLHTIDSCYLCLKYPFLYPRNRFTGNHYNNWKIIDYCDALQKECIANGRYKEWKDDSKNICVRELPEVKTKKIVEKYPLPEHKNTAYYFIDADDKEVELYDPRHGDTPLIHLIKDAEDGTKKTEDYFYTVKFGWIRIGDYEKVPSKTSSENSDSLIFDHDDYKMHYFNLIVKPDVYKKMKLIRWLHDNLLATLFFIPTHNEIDAMDDGWFRAFGMQMLDELKAQLKKEGMLYKYRIMQIKEKFGDLRWYDSASSQEVFNIIEKYSEISYHTCITCGRPADYITSGYILPLCKLHINPADIERATDLHAPKKDDEEENEIEENC